ncbi:MAG: sensor domain-containing diguanylate cyclase [Lysinibacillus sp.]
MNERLRKAPCGFLSLTENGILTEVNQTFLDWLGYGEEDLLGHHVEDLLPRSTRLILHAYFFPNINLHGHIEELFLSFRDSSGKSIPLLLNARRNEWNGSQVIDCIVVQMKKRMDYELELRSAKRKMEEAYAEKEQALARLQQIYREIEEKQAELLAINSGLIELSNTDKLTGIRNRRFFQEKLEEQISLHHQEGIPFSLLIIDIDHFKKVNDTYGHQVGDVVLVKLAGLLESGIRSGDVVARFGGEEFTVLLPGTGADMAKEIAEQLNRTVAQAAWEETGSLTVSIGAATFSGKDTEASILVNADRALYASKRNGRNRTSHFDELD